MSLRRDGSFRHKVDSSRFEIFASSTDFIGATLHNVGKIAFSVDEGCGLPLHVGRRCTHRPGHQIKEAWHLNGRFDSTGLLASVDVQIRLVMEIGFRILRVQGLVEGRNY